MEFRTKPPELRIRAIVRDKYGKIRCDDPSKLAEFFEADKMRVAKGHPPRLSADDIKDLKERFGDNICN